MINIKKSFRNYITRAGPSNRSKRVRTDTLVKNYKLICRPNYVCLFVFYGISTFVGYSMPIPLPYK